MHSFIFCARVLCAGLALPVMLSMPAASQDRDSLARRCLSIADINERIDCLEAGAAPDSGPASPSNTNPLRQPSANPSFDCRAARTSIERAICGDVTLSDWDSRMGRLFQQTLRLAKDRQSLSENQRLWLIQRDHSCGAVADGAIWSCLLEMTKARVTALTKPVSTVEALPPVQTSPTLVTPVTPQGRAESPPNEPGNSALSTSPVSQKGSSTGAPSGDNNFSPMILLAVFVLGIAIALRTLGAIRRKKRLVARFGEEIAALIIARKVWQGMTEEQLTESWGNPVDVGREIIRSKVKETWKYGQTGKNRFRNRVYLENGIVIGWKN